MKSKFSVIAAVIAICGSLPFGAFADQGGSGGPGNSTPVLNLDVPAAARADIAGITGSSFEVKLSPSKYGVYQADLVTYVDAGTPQMQTTKVSLPVHQNSDGSWSLTVSSLPQGQSTIWLAMAWNTPVTSVLSEDDKRNIKPAPNVSIQVGNIYSGEAVGHEPAGIIYGSAANYGVVEMFGQ